MFKTFKSKINISYFTLFIFVFTALVISIQIYLKSTLENNLSFQMVQYINLVESLEESSSNKKVYNELLKKIAENLKVRLTFINFEGNVLFDSVVDNILEMDNHILRQEIQESEKQNIGVTQRFSSTLQKKMFYVVRKAKNFYIRVAKPVSQVNEIIYGASKFIYIIAGFFLIILIFVNYVLANHLSNPVKDIVNFSKRFKQGEYDVRLPVYKLDELGFVKLSLNYMAKSVSKNVDNLSMQKIRLEKIVKSVSEGILLLDEDGKVFLYNQGFFNVLEISKREMQNLLYFEAISNSRIINLIDEALLQDEKKKDNFTITKSGSFETKTINVSCIPLENKKGAVILFEDITEEFNLTKLKREFVSNASHEFKTPLAIMKGYVETLLGGVEDKAKQTDFLEKIHNNLIRLNNIINDVITLNKIEDYKDLFAFHKTNITKLIEDCVELLSPAAIKNEITLINEVTDKVKINTAPELLEIILFNLIDNGIKYNEKKGYVKITHKVKKESIIISIIDSGLGIPQGQSDKIFERFFIVNGGRSRDKGGTGLGLSIVKHAVSILKGEISVSNNPEERGSVFTIKLPINVKRS